MTQLRKRTLSLFMALMLVFSLFTLLPGSALKASADIPGSGTKDSPAIVKSYDDLMLVLESYYGSELYIKLGSDVISNDILNYNYIIIERNVHIDLNGHQLRRVSNATIDNCLIRVSSGCLTIDDSVGTGLISCSLQDKFAKTVSVTNSGSLVLNAGTISLDDPEHEDYGNRQVYRDSLYQSGGTVTINGGNIKGFAYIMRPGTFSPAPVTRIYGGSLERIYKYGEVDLKIYGADLKYGFDPGSYVKMAAQAAIDENSRVSKNGEVISRDNFHMICSTYPGPTHIEQPTPEKVNVSITKELLKAGKDPEDAMPSLANSSGQMITSYQWRHAENNEKITDRDVFETGKSYYLEVELIPEYYYYNLKVLSNDGYTVKLNNELNGEILSVDRKVMNVRFKIDIQKPPITNVSLSIYAPVDGEKVSDYSAAFNIPEYLRINRSGRRDDNTYFYWHEGEKILTSSANFVGGHTYTAYIRFKAVAGYELADDLNVKIRGKEATFVGSEDDGWVTYKADFVCGGSSQQRQVGDLNNDGRITADDAIIAARYAAGYTGYAEKYDKDIADMNRDGSVTADDAIIIARYAAGYSGYEEKYKLFI